MLLSLQDGMTHTKDIQKISTRATKQCYNNKIPAEIKPNETGYQKHTSAACNNQIAKTNRFSQYSELLSNLMR